MAVRVLGGGDGGLPVVLPAHVEMDVPRADLLGEGLALVVEDVGDDHPCALGGEQPGLLLALAARGAGDDDDPSVELAHVRPPSQRWTRWTPHRTAIPDVRQMQGSGVAEVNLT